MDVLYNSLSRVNIIINEDMDAFIITEDMDILDKFSMEDYYAPSPEELIKKYDSALKKYFHIGENIEYLKVNEKLYKHAFDSFMKSDFLKEYKEYNEEE